MVSGTTNSPPAASCTLEFDTVISGGALLNADGEQMLQCTCSRPEQALAGQAHDGRHQAASSAAVPPPCQALRPLCRHGGCGGHHFGCCLLQLMRQDSGLQGMVRGCCHARPFQQPVAAACRAPRSCHAGACTATHCSPAVLWPCRTMTPPEYCINMVDGLVIGCCFLKVQCGTGRRWK